MKAHIVSSTGAKYSFFENHELGWMKHLNKAELGKHIALYTDLFSMNTVMSDVVYVRSCEPPNDVWVRDESFYELEGTFQRAIFRYEWEKCHMHTCDIITTKKSIACNAHYYDYRTGCSGKLTDCIELRGIEACVLISGPQRFHYVISKYQGLYGNSGECPSDDSYKIDDNPIENSPFSTCACNCDDNSSKISLYTMESRVESNMVITGIRFIRQDQVLHIQAREGKLQANGRISRYSERWRPIPRNISESQLHPINLENRVFFLDDLQLPSSYVLTGVKFDKVRRGSVTGFALRIFGVLFDFKSGILIAGSNSRVSQKISDNNPGEPLVFEPKNPAKTTLPLTINPGKRKYVTLEQSSLQEDFGQSTLPLFDAVSVLTHPSSALGGIGIFYKGADNYAGFISLRAYGIKYHEYFRDFQATCIKNHTVSFDEFM